MMLRLLVGFFPMLLRNATLWHEGRLLLLHNLLVDERLMTAYARLNVNDRILETNKDLATEAARVCSFG